MKKITLLLSLSSIITLSIYAQTASNGISIPSFDDKYSNYVSMLENGDTIVDYQDFRFSFIDSEQFKIASSKYAESNELTKKMYEQMDKANYDEVSSIAKQLLGIDYTNMLAHKILRQTYQIIGDTVNAQKYKAVQFGLLHSIVDNGDGKTCKTGWPVIQVSEEYFILNMIGAKVNAQSLYNKDGTCDKMDVTVDGEINTYYFDVSKIFEGYKKRGMK